MSPDHRQAPIAKGNFAKRPFAHILIYLENRKMNGTLLVQPVKGADAKDEVKIYFQKGFPAKVVAPEKKRASQHPPEKRYPLKLVEIFAYTDGAYAFYGDVDLADPDDRHKRVSFDPYAILMTGLRYHGAALPLDDILSPLNKRWFAITDTAMLKRFNLNEAEKAVCDDLSQKPINHAKLNERKAHDPQTIRYVLYTLLITKQLQIWSASPSSPAAPQVAAPSARMSILPGAKFASSPVSRTSISSAPDARTSSTSSIPIQQRPTRPSLHEPTPSKMQALEDEAESVAVTLPGQNYYEMLGLTNEATSTDVRKAFFKLAKKYHPDRIAGTKLPALKEKLQFIFTHLSQAHETLTNEDEREAYDKSIEEGRERTSSAPEISSETQVREVLEAENLHQRALVLIRRSQFKEALELIERVRVLNANETEYLATWAHVTGELRKPKANVDDLLDHLRQAHNDHPKSERIALYLAKMLERANHFAEARTYYEKVLDRNPDNIEAGRAVRIMEMRERKEANKPKGFFKRFLNK